MSGAPAPEPIMPAVWPRPIGPIAPIARLIGEAAALRLAEERGGTRVYISAKVEPGQGLAAIIGVDAAQAMFDHYSHGEFKAPLAREWRILVYRAAGLSYPQIALRAGTSESNVWHVLARHQQTRQFDLFPAG